MKHPPLWMYGVAIVLSLVALAFSAKGEETPGQALDATISQADANTAQIESLTGETRDLRAEVAGHETRITGAENGLSDEGEINHAQGLELIEIKKRLDALEAGTPAPGPDPIPEPSGSPFIDALEPVADAGKPLMQLGLGTLNDPHMEEPFANMVHSLGNSWAAGQNWPGNQTMDMSALKSGGYLDPETLVPTTIPPGFDYIRTGLIRTGAKYDPKGYAGTYIVTWDGPAKARTGLSCNRSDQQELETGKLTFKCTEKDADNTNVQFFGFGPGEGPTNIAIYRADDEEAVKAGRLFSDRFVKYASRYHIIRTMDQQGATVAAARSVDFLSRMEQAGWGTNPKINYEGLPMGPPIEMLFREAVATDTALWMHVAGPIGASERFDDIALDGKRHTENFNNKLQMQWAEEEAPQILASAEWDKYADEIVRSLIASGYPETRALYIETANEVWNNGNPFWWYRDYFLGLRNWVNKQAPVDGYGSMVGVGYMEGRFAVALEKALKKQNRKQAVTFVLACQHANPATCDGAAKGFKRYFSDNNIDVGPFLKRAGISTASYYHEGTSRTVGLFPAANDEELKTKWLTAIKTDPKGTAKRLTDWYLTANVENGLPRVVEMRAKQEAVAASHGVAYIGDYEGESHDAANDALRSEPAFVKWYFDVWMDGPEGERLTKAWADLLYAENPKAILSNYAGVCLREVRYPWCDGVWGQDTGRRRALEEYLRH